MGCKDTTISLLRPARIFTVAAILAASMSLVFSLLACTEKREGAQKHEKILNVKVAKVTRQVHRPMVETVGSIRPLEEVVVSSEVDGVLKEVFVEEGDRVAKGQVLAQVNDIDYRLAVQAAEASLKLAEANHENAKTTFLRMEALFRKEVISKQEYDNQITRLDVSARELDRARTQLSIAQERLNKTVIRSPIKGEVRQKLASAGDFVGAGRALFRVVDAEKVKIVFAVPEKDAPKVKPGQDVSFTVDAYPGRNFPGTVSAVLPNLDEHSRMLEVHALAPNRSGELKPGMFARVRVFVGSERPIVVIPVTAVLYEGTRTRVFMAEKGYAREREVKLGAKYDEMMEVISGVEEGESIIVLGQNAAADGVKIRVVE